MYWRIVLRGEMEELLKPDEVASILKISKAKAYSLLNSGEIPTVRIGVLLRVRRADLEWYIREKTALKVRGEAKNEASTDSP